MSIGMKIKIRKIVDNLKWDKDLGLYSKEHDLFYRDIDEFLKLEYNCTFGEVYS